MNAAPVSSWEEVVRGEGEPGSVGIQKGELRVGGEGENGSLGWRFAGNN